MGDIDAAELLHFCLALLLLFEKLFLARHVAAVQLLGHVFAERRDRRSRNDVAANGPLDWYLELVSGDLFGKLFAVVQRPRSRLVAMNEVGKRVNRLLVDKNIDFHDIGFSIFDRHVIERLANVVLGYNKSALLYDGSFHDVDSSEMAFKIAGSMGFKAAAKSAGQALLEPIMDIEVVVPEQFMGDVIGDLSSRRGKVGGMDARGRHIRHVPRLSEVGAGQTCR